MYLNLINIEGHRFFIFNLSFYLFIFFAAKVKQLFYFWGCWFLFCFLFLRAQHRFYFIFLSLFTWTNRLGLLQLKLVNWTVHTIKIKKKKKSQTLLKISIRILNKIQNFQFLIFSLIGQHICICKILKRKSGHYCCYDLILLGHVFLLFSRRHQTNVLKIRGEKVKHF